MTSWAEIQRQVFSRARNRCEYCQMHQSLQGATFHVEHVHPQALGGDSNTDNLALACPRCNLCKSTKIDAVDPVTGIVAPLFNPRSDTWANHFSWDGFQVSAASPIGRATIDALDLNHPRRITIRQAEANFALFPFDPDVDD